MLLRIRIRENRLSSSRTRPKEKGSASCRTSPNGTTEFRANRNTCLLFSNLMKRKRDLKEWRDECSRALNVLSRGGGSREAARIEDGSREPRRICRHATFSREIRSQCAGCYKRFAR